MEDQSIIQLRHCDNPFVAELIEELLRAIRPGHYHSAHEALAVLQEEVHEFMLEVYKKRENRDRANMRKELIQIAAVAWKAAISLRLEERP